MLLIWAYIIVAIIRHVNVSLWNKRSLLLNKQGLFKFMSVCASFISAAILTRYLPVCLSACLSACLPVCLSVYLYIHPSVRPSVTATATTQRIKSDASTRSRRRLRLRHLRRFADCPGRIAQLPLLAVRLLQVLVPRRPVLLVGRAARAIDAPDHQLLVLLVLGLRVVHLVLVRLDIVGSHEGAVAFRTPERPGRVEGRGEAEVEAEVVEVEFAVEVVEAEVEVEVGYGSGSGSGVGYGNGNGSEVLTGSVLKRSGLHLGAVTRGILNASVLWKRLPILGEGCHLTVVTRNTAAMCGLTRMV